MRTLLLFALALSLGAQQLSVSCEPAASTLRLLEAVPPVADVSLPYEQRVGALRLLAATHPEDSLFSVPTRILSGSIAR